MLLLNSQTIANIESAYLMESGRLDSAKKLLLHMYKRGNEYAMDSMMQAVLAMQSESSAVARPKQLPIRTFMIKPVGDVCNLKCDYCYERERLGSNKQYKMSLVTLKSIIDNVVPYSDENLMIYFHGGEPLLIGIEFFKKAIEYVRAYKNGLEIKFGLQTNATLLNQEWCDFIKEYDISIGVSIDGPKELHDYYRQDYSGRGSFDDVMNGVDLLRKNKIPFGVISVITPRMALDPEAPAKLFNFFDEQGFKHYDVHPAYSPTNKANSYNITPSEYSEFMNALFDLWLSKGDPEIRIAFIADFFESLTGFKTAACYRSGHCQMIMGVDPSGIASPCTRPFDAKYNFGDLTQQNLNELLDADSFKLFSKDEFSGQAITKDCKWSHFCGNGSCPHERLNGNGQDISGKHIYCTCHSDTQGGYPAIFQHMLESIEAEFSDYALRELT